MVFTIDELAYALLAEYLESVKLYFARYEDSREIVSDIENRIAEKLRALLDRNDRQVVMEEDIQAVITEMGTARDFEAFDEEPPSTHEPFFETPPNAATPEEEFRPHLRLTRLRKNHLLGGVSSGLSSYLSTEVWIIRLIFLITAFLFGTGLLAYLALWISLPDGEKIPESQRIIGVERSQKLYRNADDMVLGGVASGLAAYFSIDPVIIRLLFFISLLSGGIGLVIYGLLWLSLPKAKTLVERVEMKGQKANLENIEAEVRSQQATHEDQERPILIKIITFPINVLEVILRWISQNMGGLFKGGFQLVKLALGLFLTAFGGILTLACIVCLGAIFMFTSGIINGGNLPEDVRNFSGSGSYDAFIAVCAFAVFTIPFLLIGVTGFRMITDKKIIGAGYGKWMLFSWVIMLILTIFNLFYMVNAFSKEGRDVRLATFTYPKKGVLKINLPEYMDGGYQAFSFKVSPINDTSIKVEQTRISRGKSSEQAAQYARFVTQKITYQDSLMSFEPSLRQKGLNTFRAAEMKTKIMIPYDKKFSLSERVIQHLSGENIIDTFYNHELTDKVLIFASDGVKCLNCEPSQLLKDRAEEEARRLEEEKGKEQ